MDYWSTYLNDDPLYLCYLVHYIAGLRHIHTVLKLIYWKKEDDYYERWRTDRVLYTSSLSLLPYLFNIIYINRVSQNTNWNIWLLVHFLKTSHQEGRVDWKWVTHNSNKLVKWCFKLPQGTVEILVGNLLFAHVLLRYSLSYHLFASTFNPQAFTTQIDTIRLNMHSIDCGCCRLLLFLFSNFSTVSWV